MRNSHYFSGLWISFTLFMCLSFIPLILNAQVQVNGTFTDIRDGHVYHWVKEGKQVWMTGNLTFNAPVGSWAYNDDSVNEVNFGRLYSWKAALTSCPKGWHLPTDKEWGILIQTFGGDSIAGLKMQNMDTIGKSKGIPGVVHPAVESTLLSGIRHADGSCIGLNLWGGCWTADKVNDTIAKNVLFIRRSNELGLSTNDKNSGFSVRCVRNK
jgi:uncharacterized protein (TIGR02145 family)